MTGFEHESELTSMINCEELIEEGIDLGKHKSEDETLEKFFGILDDDELFDEDDDEFEDDFEDDEIEEPADDDEIFDEDFDFDEDDEDDDFFDDDVPYN